jgi:F0F1-type ATP synthase membrane subunit c/vacuolar-type H+-ATPase subunit K
VIVVAVMVGMGAYGPGGAFSSVVAAIVGVAALDVAQEQPDDRTAPSGPDLLGPPAARAIARR